MKNKTKLSSVLVMGLMASAFLSSCEDTTSTVAGLLLPANATLINGVSVFSSASPAPGSSVDHLIDNSGLSGGSSHTATHTIDLNGHWVVNQGTNVDLTFNLGGSFDLYGTYIWQQNTQESSRDVKSFDILVSSNGVDFTEISSNHQLRRGTPMTRTATNATSNMPSDSFATTATGVTHVRIHIDNSYHTNVMALGEVKFMGAPSATTP